MIFENIQGVPNFKCDEYADKKTKYSLIIPIINEGERIKNQLLKAQAHKIDTLCDIIICDGGSTDNCTNENILKTLGVNTLLVKQGPGKQGVQMRMGFYWALKRGYEGIITIDGNNKDSIEDVIKFIEKLDDGYDFVQGSRFIKGGVAENTPLIRWIAVRFIHAPVISLTAGKWYTDTTNAFRAHSKKYLTHEDVKPFRDVFLTYELLAYLSVRANQLGLKTCEIPVKRAYPKGEKAPTKIKGFSANAQLMKILFQNFFRKFNAKEGGN